MPRNESKKYPNRKVAEFYNSEQEDRNSEDYRDAVNTTIDAAEKAIDAITRIFWDHSTKKPHISKDLIRRLEPIWDDEVAPVLIKEFGRNTPLSTIFYQGNDSDEVLMEVWDSRHVQTKSSQVFTITGVPRTEIQYFARNREQASVINLKNWI